jgi:hypothetical protein
MPMTYIVVYQKSALMWSKVERSIVKQTHYVYLQFLLSGERLITFTRLAKAGECPPDPW